MNSQLLVDILYIIEGSYITLLYSIISIFFGLIIGIILAISKLSSYSLARYFSNFYTSIFRGTPLLIQLSIIYYVLPQLGVKLSVFLSGIIALSLNSGAYVSEIIRAGIESIDSGQLHSAQVLSISKFNTYKDIIIPQAVKNILPSLISELINLIKESAVISYIGGYDLMRRAHLIAAAQYTYFFPLITAALCYYIMVMVIAIIGRYIEKRLKYD